MKSHTYLGTGSYCPPWLSEMFNRADGQGPLIRHIATGQLTIDNGDGSPLLIVNEGDTIYEVGDGSLRVAPQSSEPEAVNFTDYPTSIGEARAIRDHDASAWTPRDALINLLREIDSGNIEPDAMVCAYRVKESDGVYSCHYVSAVPDPDIALGLLMRTQARLIGGCGG